MSSSLLLPPRTSLKVIKVVSPVTLLIGNATPVVPTPTCTKVDVIDDIAIVLGPSRNLSPPASIPEILTRSLLFNPWDVAATPIPIPFLKSKDISSTVVWSYEIWVIPFPTRVFTLAEAPLPPLSLLLNEILSLTL